VLAYLLIRKVDPRSTSTASPCARSGSAATPRSSRVVLRSRATGSGWSRWRPSCSSPRRARAAAADPVHQRRLREGAHRHGRSAGRCQLRGRAGQDDRRRDDPARHRQKAIKVIS
jgi:hypothetical protein